MPPAPDTLARIALAPLLIAQGVGVRARALRLPAPPGPREGTAGDGPPLRLLVLGDSSAAGVGAAHQREGLAGQLAARLAPQCRLQWTLLAESGATTQDAIGWLEAMPAARYDCAVVALGVNDVTRSVPLRRWLGRQARLRALLAERFGTARIVVSGLPPMGRFPALPQPLRRVMGAMAARYDAALGAAIAEAGPGLRHVPFALPFTPDLMADDGFHPSAAGYALWAEILAPEVLRGLSPGAPAR